MCVFLQRYFGIYLLRGISTLDAPALPRVPVCACVRLCAYLCAYARLYIAVASPRRAGALLCDLFGVLGCASLSVHWVSCAPYVLASFALLLRFFCALGCASSARPWLRFCIVFCMAFLLRKALALSFIHTSAFCIIFILFNACVPKTFLYESYI